jgi:hypothetical protein
MRSVPLQRPESIGNRETLTPEEFRQRASRDESGADAAANRETFLRNEWGTRTFGYSSLVVDPPNGRIPEMTPAGLARAANRDGGTFGPGPFNDFEDFTLYDRCITRGVLGSTLPVIYGNGMRIVQNPESVAISYEMIHDTRIFPLDGRPHLDEDIRQYLGNARGRWDGDTLVVETRNFTNKTSIGANGNGTRHSEAMTLTERFTRVDPDMIEYIATVNDPVSYTAPFTIRLMITKQPNYETFEYSCHEGNGAVGHALSGERAFEKQVAEALARGEPPPQRSLGNGIYGGARRKAPSSSTSTPANDSQRAAGRAARGAWIVGFAAAGALLGARRRGSALPHEELPAVRQRDVAAAGPERAVLRLEPFYEHPRAGRHGVAVPAVTNQGVRRSALDGPLLFLAGSRRDLDVQPRMRIAELHLRDDALEPDRPIDVELRSERMVRDDGRGDDGKRAAAENTQPTADSHSSS